MSILGLAPAAEAAELDAISGFLAQFDNPEVLGDHCRRHGGGRLYPSDAVEQAGEVDIAGNNALLTHHRQWHDDIVPTIRSPFFLDDANTYGDQFRNFHKDMIAEYDAWRAAHGFDPTPTWDPATPVPREFAYSTVVPPGPVANELPRYLGEVFVCVPHGTEDPKQPLPTWATVQGGDAQDPAFHYQALCEFPSINRLGKAIDVPSNQSYHSQVHLAVLGDLAPVYSAPRDPLFWPWHNFLEVEVFQKWENECEEPAAVQDVATVHNAVPGFEAPDLFALLIGACLVVVRRRRG